MSSIRDYATEYLERELKMEQMRADISLKRAQAATEWPKTLTAALVASAAIIAAIFSALGFILGQNYHR